MKTLTSHLPGAIAMLLVSLLMASCCHSNLVVQKIKASDAEPNDLFGTDVDIWGNYAVVNASFEGNPNYYGAIYFFKRTPKGKWVQTQKIPVPQNKSSSQGFVGPVALSMDHAVFGVKSGSNGLYPNGSVFVYKRSGDSWNFLQTIKAPIGASKRFGHLIDIDGGFLVVGDFHHQGPRHVHVYQLKGNLWTLQQTIAPPLPPPAAQSPVHDLAIDGYRLIIGDGIAEKEHKAAYVYAFVPDAQGWSLEKTLTPPDLQFTSSFGGAVAITQRSQDDYVVLVGDHGHKQAGANAGAAYFFHRDNSGWKPPQKVVASQINAGDFFGQAVAIDGNSALVGSKNHGAQADDAGAAFEYCRGLSGWFGRRLLASDGQKLYQFGNDVAIDDSRFIVGSISAGYKGPRAGLFAPGAAYVYEPRAKRNFPILNPNKDLHPWPYIYRYTGCPIAKKGKPLKMSLSAGKGVSLSVEVAEPPRHGAIELRSGSSLAYVPEDAFTGTDEFVIAVEDQQGNKNEVALQVLVQER